MSIGKPTAELFDAYAQVCRELGATQEVGPAYYRWFINLSDKPLLELLELIVLDRAEEINSWVFAERQPKTDQDIRDYLETLLELFGHGFLQLTADAQRKKLAILARYYPGLLVGGFSVRCSPHISCRCLPRGTVALASG
jgi:hypothetical protein